MLHTFLHIASEFIYKQRSRVIRNTEDKIITPLSSPDRRLIFPDIFSVTLLFLTISSSLSVTDACDKGTEPLHCTRKNLAAACFELTKTLVIYKPRGLSPTYTALLPRSRVETIF